MKITIDGVTNEDNGVIENVRSIHAFVVTDKDFIIVADGVAHAGELLITAYRLRQMADRAERAAHKELDEPDGSTPGESSQSEEDKL